jgi:hypothetical protein
MIQTTCGPYFLTTIYNSVTPLHTSPRLSKVNAAVVARTNVLHDMGTQTDFPEHEAQFGGECDGDFGAHAAQTGTCGRYNA